MSKLSGIFLGLRETKMHLGCLKWEHLKLNRGVLVGKILDKGHLLIAQPLIIKAIRIRILVHSLKKVELQLNLDLITITI